MASRESFSIKNYWKFAYNVPSKYVAYKYKGLEGLNPFILFYIRCYSVGSLFLRVILGRKWERYNFWNDSFIQPFYEHIGCKFVKHKWFYMDDEGIAFCVRCHTRSEYIPKEQWDRMEKLRNIKKRIKK